MTGKIIGTGSYIPERIITNDELSGIVDTNDEWIRERTGIRQRHVISGNETTISMSAEASGRAIEMAGIRPDEIDMIFLATSSSNSHIPAAACRVQALIGAENAVGYDISAACSGFVFAFNTAQAFIRSGMARTVLVVGADSVSNLVDWSDRSSCILFGDGAGAAVVQATNEDIPFSFAMHSQGNKGDALTVNSRHQRVQPPAGETYLRMDGKEILRFSLTRVPQVIREVLEKQQVSKDEIDLYILHQANGRIIESIIKKMQIPSDKVPVNVAEYANFSAGTVPVLLDQLNRSGKLYKGQKLILCGFGAGLAWGAAYIEWQNKRITQMDKREVRE